ncbi:hypothetical protein Hanom_Chr15g01406661 [Helianthus anomalus]
MYLSEPMNFIFIGFEGSGNQALKLHAEEIERWFTKTDHIFELTRILQTEDVFTPFYKNKIYINHQNHLSIVSYLNWLLVSYVFFINFLSSGTFTSTTSLSMLSRQIRKLIPFVFVLADYLLGSFFVVDNWI